MSDIVSSRWSIMNFINKHLISKNLLELKELPFFSYLCALKTKTLCKHIIVLTTAESFV